MTAPEPLAVLLVLGWGVIVGLDLSSWGQLMLSRPLIAGSVAGLLLGDPSAGLAAGAILELFALDVLPIGATRYPDLGLAAVGASVVAAGAPAAQSLGAAVGFGLLLAMASQPMIEWVRRANARAAHREADRLAGGDVAVVSRLQAGGLLRDVLRSTILAGAGIGLGLLLRQVLLPANLALTLLLVAVAGGVAAALHGLMRASSQGGRLVWAAAGLLVGIGILWLR